MNESLTTEWVTPVTLWHMNEFTFASCADVLTYTKAG